MESFISYDTSAAPLTLGLEGLVGAAGALPSTADSAERDAPSAAGLLELLAGVQAAEEFEPALQQLCRGLATWSGATRVVLGLANSQGHVKVAAVSDSAQLDRRAELTLAFGAALDETLTRPEPTSWCSTHSEAGPIFRQLARLASTDAMIGLPLRNQRGEPVGAVLFCGSSHWHAQLAQTSALAVCQRPMASCLDLFRSARSGPWKRLLVAGRTRAGKKRARWFVAAIAIVGSILVFPLPFKVKCDVTVEPVVRRYVAAPFDGTLEKTFVEPGNRVSKGQVLAVLDGRELRLELAGLEAEIGAAAKKRVAALASHEPAAAQLATLEMAQLETKIEAINQRLQHLSVQCPMDGVVISGDLRRTEGAPLSIGQTLFEIAPLDRMIAEIAVPQDEVGHVRRGMPVELRFEAFPGQSWQGKLVKVHPRAELRDQSTVFIGEVPLENAGRQLSPGMSGRAKIETRNRSLGWILFHRSANALVQKMGW